MLKPSDVTAIVNALDSDLPRVREAARRVMVLLASQLPSESILSRRVPGTDDIESDSPASPPDVQTLLGIVKHPPLEQSEPRVRQTWGTPELWLDTLANATDPYKRLDAALDLATTGDTQWVEQAVNDVERVPWDLDSLGGLREDDLPPLPVPLMARLREIARDETRRGDVRQIAHLLSCKPDEDELRENGPSTPDLFENAIRLAEDYLDHAERIGVGGPVAPAESFRYLDPERASLLITVSFQRCYEAAFSRDAGYAVGNDIGALLRAFERKYVPDIPALFEIYAAMSPLTAAAREDYYRTRDEEVVLFAASGHLAVSWQIAWTVGRVGLVHLLAELSRFSDPTEDEAECVSALNLLEDAIRFLPNPRFPLYGGVTTPEMDDTVLAHVVAESVSTASETLGYHSVRVFYGTNRAPLASWDSFPRYGVKDGALELGVCDVSIPQDHKIGRLESPPPYSFFGRQNPARYVVLLNVERQSTTAFCSSLADAVGRSNDKHALVFVHGYRVTFEDAARRTAQLCDDLGIATPIFFSWPSQGRFLPYQADTVMAERSVPELVKFLDLLASRSGAEVIHLIAHSMGSLALSRAIVDYLGERPRTSPKFRELILAAPDIDATIFRDQIVPRVRGRGPRMTVYASRCDYALLLSRWLRSGLSRAGFIEGTTPLVVPGVETIDVSEVNTECFWGALRGHSYIGGRPPVVQDLSDLLRHGLSAGERFGNKQCVLNGLPYWVMKSRVG